MTVMEGFVRGWNKMDPMKPPYDSATSGAAIIRSPVKYEDHVQLKPHEVKKMEYNLAETFQKDEKFQAWRGHIINNALFIEEKVDTIISNLLFYDLEKKVLFQSIILSREFFGFMNKWKVLKDLMGTMEIFKDGKYNIFFSNLHKLINERDKFAHGKVTYMGDRGEKIILEYFKEKIQKEEITEKTVEEFVGLAKECRKVLDEIIGKITTAPQPS